MASVLVTGAARGIGLELVRCYRADGFDVIASCRAVSDALRASGAEIVDQVELSEPMGIERLSARLAGHQLNQIVLNAGVLVHDQLGMLRTSAAEIRRQFEINALAPLLLVEALLQNLGEGSKIGLISSRVGSIADNGSGRNYGYRMSKAALNIAGKSLSIELKPRGIAVFLLHPGYVQTDMTGGQGDVTPAQSAANLKSLMDRLDFSQTGSFWHANGSALPW